jgi:hypothetical protein
MDTPAPAETASHFGAYTLLRSLGRGGMAEVWLALREGLAGIRQLVVIKRILGEGAADPDMVRMFLEEARIASTLAHQGICQVYEVGEVRGRHYIAMEYLHGQDVRAFCRRLARMRKPLPLEHSLFIVQEAAAALHYAHTRTDLAGKPMNVIHRDVSPQNLFVTYDGAVKLLDFGIAKAATTAHKTAAGVLKGKLKYMSPEQALGLPLTPASDVYALGIVLWELTTGKRLWRSDTDFKLLEEVARGEVPSPRSIWPEYYPELEHIVMSALQREPERRTPSARALQRELQAFTRREGLFGGEVELGEMMHSLFAERLEQERAALARGQELYEFLRDRARGGGEVSGPGESLDAASGETELPEPTRVTRPKGAGAAGGSGTGEGRGASAFAPTVADEPRRPRSALRTFAPWLAAGFAISAAIVGAVALTLFVTDRGDADDVAAHAHHRSDDEDDGADRAHRADRTGHAGHADHAAHADDDHAAGTRHTRPDPGPEPATAAETAAATAAPPSTDRAPFVPVSTAARTPRPTPHVDPPAATSAPATATGAPAPIVYGSGPLTGSCKRYIACMRGLAEAYRSSDMPGRADAAKAWDDASKTMTETLTKYGIVDMESCAAGLAAQVKNKESYESSLTAFGWVFPTAACR